MLSARVRSASGSAANSETQSVYATQMMMKAEVLKAMMLNTRGERADAGAELSSSSSEETEVCELQMLNTVSC